MNYRFNFYRSDYKQTSKAFKGTNKLSFQSRTRLFCCCASKIISTIYGFFSGKKFLLYCTITPSLQISVTLPFHFLTDTSGS